MAARVPLVVLDGKYIPLDLGDFLVDSGGTPISGGGSLLYEEIPISATYPNKYVEFTYAPRNLTNIQLFINTQEDQISPLQRINVDYSIVRVDVGGSYRRIVWDKDAIPGSSFLIPDAMDLPPSRGMNLKDTDILLIYYFI